MIDYITVTYKFKGTPTQEEKREVIAEMRKHGFMVEKNSKTYIRFIKFN